MASFNLDSSVALHRILRTHHQKIVVCLIVCLVTLLLACPDPNERLFFVHGDKKSDKLTLSLGKGRRQMRLEGSRSLIGDEWKFSLAITLTGIDTASFRIDSAALGALYRGHLIPKQSTTVHSFVKSRDEIIMQADFWAEANLRRLWIERDESSQLQKLQIVLDSAFIWQNQPIQMDTIEAYFKLPVGSDDQPEAPKGWNSPE